jgi:hypothetical protein
MKNAFRAALFFACGAVVLNAQTAAPQSATSEVLSTRKTGGAWNGRFWKQLSAEEKRVFLFGYSDGVEQVTIAAGAGSFERYKQINKMFWASALTIDEVRSALNVFYETPENSPISISNAIYLISKRSEGASEAELQKEIADLRARATK